MEANNCMCKNKKKNKSVVAEVFSDYCSSTSIHGIGYLGAKDTNIFEKIWWIIVFILSLTACIFLIRQTWTKWNESPMVVAFSTEQIPVWEVPFPAVTICPLRKLRDFYYDQLMDYKNRTKIAKGEEFVKAHKKIWDVEQVCDLQSFFIDYRNKPSEYTDEDIIKNIKDVSTSMLSTIRQQSFKSNFEYGPGRFAEQITSEGLCFTFNALGRNDMYTNEVKKNITLIDHDRTSTGWTIEEGYEIDDDDAYPWRTAGEGVTAGLIILAFSDWFNRDYVCNEAVTGFKIIIHNPADAPKVKDQYILAPPNKQVTIAVNPKVITTSKGLKNIRPEVRKCYFSDDEKKLRFYKIYTQNNCKAECLINVTKAWCSCVPFYLPHDNNTRICGRGKSDCVIKAREELLKYENNVNKNYIADNAKRNATFQIFSKCSCLPFCASLDYEYQISSSDYRFIDTVAPNQVNYWRGDVTHLKIFFQDSQFMALHRSELYGQTDFIANIGGLLGLFMGFSFLSLLEIVYFLTLRIWCKLNNKRSIKKRQSIRDITSEFTNKRSSGTDEKY